MAVRSTESEVLAQELEHVGHKIESLEARVKEVEAVIPRLETAAETTARAMEEVSPIGTRCIGRCGGQSSSGGTTEGAYKVLALQVELCSPRLIASRDEARRCPLRAFGRGSGRRASSTSLLL